MSARSLLSRRAPLALAALACTLSAAALAWEAGRAKDPPKPPVASLYPKLEKAANPVTLQLQADDRKVVGWVSGDHVFTGRPVYVSIEGKRQDTKLVVGKDNTFTWDYKVAKPTAVEFRVDNCYLDVPTPMATFVLNPAPADPGPAAFFVVDRTAYRPGQPLHFAAFLRTEVKGEFVPVPNKAVEVELVSQAKATKAAKLKLTSDAQGRVVGSYTFADGDALDHYTLAIPGFKGSARVLLGEYRKSKVRLKISGSVADDKMTVTFQGQDFLDKPVPMAKASFVAQVVRRGKQKDYTLKAEDFVHHSPKPFSFTDLESLSEEDLLYWDAEGVSGQTFAGLGNVALAQFAHELAPKDDTPATHTLDLKREWLRGDCALIVTGVMTGADGREQRASTTIAIAEATDKEKRSLELHVPKTRYYTTESIRVRADGAPPTALVVMKLAFQTPSAALSGLGSAMVDPYSGRMPAFRSAAGRYRYPVPNVTADTTETVRRTLVTAVPFKGDTATLTLREPGAYKLIVTATKEDGTTLQQEKTVIVKRLEDVNALHLKLDKEEYTHDGRLTGTLQSRFGNAHALLTVRDSTGIRLTKPITFRDGLYHLDEAFPAGLRYGCTVDVLYPETSDHAHAAHGQARVVPNDRLLTVAVKTPETVTPGQTVDLDVQVNRTEPVDLVVSVYDQSLLGIAPDKAVNIRDFFLADVRGGEVVDHMLLERRVGGVRVSDLHKKAQAMLKDKDKQLAAGERQVLQNFVNNYNSRYLYTYDAATALRLAGVDVYFAPVRWGQNWYCQIQPGSSDRLIDLLKQQYSGWHLAPRFVGATLLLHETHPSYVSAGYRWHPVYGWDFNRNAYGGYGYGGYSQLQTFQAGGMNLFYEQSRGGFRGGRGDASPSWGVTNGAISGNSMHSFMPEGQAFISHMPANPGMMLMDAGPDQAHIAVRRDFSDSAFWNAAVRTDDQGKARVSFKLPDSLTNWQVVVTAVSQKMHVGGAKASFKTFKPIMVWPMLPRTFTEGDKVEVFAAVHNRTDEPQRIKVKLKVENGRLSSPEEKTIDVPAKSNVPVYWTFHPAQAGFTQLLMSADAPAGSDASLKRLPVVRAAAEQAVTIAGTVKGSATIEIPNDVDPRSGQLEITFAPSLAADMADTLNYLVEYPYGCVEQTMSRFLPAIKVAQILTKFKVKHPELEKKLPGCVAGGIKRLLELQQPDGGWGWHGGSQTHEMMTPYALYGLLQAEKAGYQIPNENAVNNGLNRLQGFINNMTQGTQIADRVYCMYVYTHRRDLDDQQWGWLEDQVQGKRLSDYALALALEMGVSRKRGKLAVAAVAALQARAKKAGGHVWWETAGFSRWGEDRFEITAAAMKALVAHDKDDPLIDGILGFFNSTKRGDRWNSTKDTAMILFAMADYLAKTEYNTDAKQRLSVAVNDREAKAVSFDDHLTKKLVVPGTKLREGKNTLTFKTTMSGVLYRAVFRYWKTGPDVPAMEHGMKVTRTFVLLDAKGAEVRPLKSGDTVPRGSYVLSKVDAAQPSGAVMSYVLVENPKPAGGEMIPVDDVRFAHQHQQSTHHVLREDREAMTCYHHEHPMHALSDRCVFLAELAGEFVVPPARVEMMYRTEVRGHSGAFVLKVADAK